MNGSMNTVRIEEKVRDRLRRQLRLNKFLFAILFVSGLTFRVQGQSTSAESSKQQMTSANLEKIQGRNKTQGATQTPGAIQTQSGNQTQTGAQSNPQNESQGEADRKQAQTPGTTVTQIQASGGGSNSEQGTQPAVLMSQAQVLKVAQTLTDLALQSSEIGAEKSKATAVKSHAHQVRQDNESFQRALKNFQKKSDLKPEASGMNSKVESFGRSRLAKMQKTGDGKDFDRAYLEQQIQLDQEALKLMSSQLINNSKDQELKDLLAKSRLTLETNLQRAKYTLETLDTSNIRH